MARRLGTSTLAILKALDDGHNYGFEVMDVTGLPGGTVYPALAKLEQDELVTSRWEAAEIARAEGRPARRYYSLSAAGSTRLRDELSWLYGGIGSAAPTRG